jgi:rSAM/selenodomain-associated transferase 1
VIVFAKAPAPGFAKTRLIPELGVRGAARLARRMFDFTLAEARYARIGTTEICVTPRRDTDHWRDIAIPTDVATTDQGDGDLGERMARAAARAFNRHKAVLLIGTDCPALTRERLRAAARVLQHHDAVMHPAADGGYALLGLKRFDAGIFEGIAWSTSAVAGSTQARIRTLGWSLHCAQTLHDIDEPGDLIHLPMDWQAHS